MQPQESHIYKIPSEAVYTILIVDDSETDKAIYQRHISKAGFSHCTFLHSECGEDGLELCQKSSPDLILLDYLLPDQNGLEFLKSLRSMVNPAPPVIMLTGQGDEKVAVEAMKIGARDYLVKGDLSAEHLNQSIQRVLSQQILQKLVERQGRQQKLMAAVALGISKAESIDEILQTAANGIGQLLDCDRTVIYQFETDMSGTIMAESVRVGFTASLGLAIEDTCFQKNGAEHYFQGHKTIIADIYNSHLTPCHVKMLERFEVKANLVVPILLPESAGNHRQLWGLLIAHHCRAPREWRSYEMALLDDLAVQLAIALRQNQLITTLEARAQELTLANQKLSHTAQLLEVRNQELDEFSYVASHDLRAPLRAIANLANWLEEDLAGKIPEENQEQLSLVQSRAKRLDDFIKGLLEYSRAGRESITIEPVDTQTLVNEVINDLAPPPSISVTVPDNMPQLKTQKLLLQQVFANLIGNAIKYHNRPEGHIKISVEERQNEIAFSISDDGPGIDPKYHEKIFGIFQTLSSRDVVESTGIGLSIIKKIVERQGGIVSLRSALGAGSTFTFTWPKTSSEL
ncbi:MAG: ATP-binding protein [Cyanobacteria bacterium P01_F01_bin.53]